MAAVLTGLLIGLLVCVAHELGPRRIDWVQVFDSAADVAQTIGVAVGGAWAYLLFVKQRLSQRRAHLEHHVTTNAINSERHVRVVVEIQNVGNVMITPKHGLVTLHRIVPMDDASLLCAKTSIATADEYWPKITSKPFASDDVVLDPGEKERYPLDFIIDGTVKVFQVHSVVYPSANKRKERHWDETSIHAV